jgi:cyclopropane-fatty-acyl-phospholipid synthase
MSSSCIEEVSVPNDDWYRIAAELLGRAGIEINGPSPPICRLTIRSFLNAFCRKGRWG